MSPPTPGAAGLVRRALAPLALLAALGLPGGACTPRRMAPAAAVADTLGALSPDTLWARATRLRARGRVPESLPYLGALARGAGADMAWVHFEYGRTLYYAAAMMDTVAGVPRPSARTSVERTALARSAIAELERALALAGDARERARVMLLLAHAEQSWGFRWEAWIWHRRAEASDPSEPSYARESEGALNAMRDPVHAQVLPGNEAPPAAH